MLDWVRVFWEDRDLAREGIEELEVWEGACTQWAAWAWAVWGWEWEV